MRAGAEDLLLGDHHERLGRHHEPGREVADRDLRRAGRAAVEGGRGEGLRVALREGHAVVLQDRREPPGLRAGAGREHHAQTLVEPALRLARERDEPVLLAVRGAARLELGDQRLLILGREPEHVVGRRGLERRERALVVGGAADEQPVHEAQPPRHQRLGHVRRVEVVRVEVERGLALRAPRREVALRSLERVGRGPHRRRRVEHHHEQIVGQVVEEGLELRIERGEEALEPEVQTAALQIVEDLLGRPRRHVDAVAELSHPHAGERDLVGAVERVLDGVHAQLAHALERALVVGVEALDREHEPVVELDARGLRRVGRVDVDERAAHRERARVLDHGDAHVAALDEHVDQLVPVELLLGAHHHRALQDRVPGRHPARQRAHRRDQEPPREPLGEVEEGGEPLHRRAAIGRHLQERARLVRRIAEHVVRRVSVRVGHAREQLEIGHRAPRRVGVRGQHEHPVLRARGVLGQQERRGARGQAGQIDPALGGQRAERVLDPRGRTFERAFEGAGGGTVAQSLGGLVPRHAPRNYPG